MSTISSTPHQRPAPAGVSSPIDPNIQAAIRRYWGFQELRPLQADAIHAALAGRDSLVVLPTGGGKSLCYQVPPLIESSPSPSGRGPG